MATKSHLFYAACTSGDMDGVKKLYNDSKVDYNWADGQTGYTSLAIACHTGRTKVVEFLLKKCSKLDLDKATVDGNTPLHLASRFGHKEIVDMLLAEKKIDTKKQNRAGLTAFYTACQFRHKEIVRVMLLDQRVDINQPQNENFTPLWCCAQYGLLSLVQLILSSGREVETRIKSVSGPADWNRKSAGEIARHASLRQRYPNEPEEDYRRCNYNGVIIADLIDAFERDAKAARLQIKQLLGLRFFFFVCFFFFRSSPSFLLSTFFSFLFLFLLILFH